MRSAIVAGSSVIQKQPGYIIVFHDSVKAAPRMPAALEETLGFYSDAGFEFPAL